MGSELPAHLLDDGFFRRVVTRAHYELWRAGVLDQLEALDLAQEVLLVLHQQWVAGTLRTTQPEELLRGLVCTVARREAISLARKKRVRRQVPAKHGTGSLDGTAAALDQFPAQLPRTSTRIRRMDAREQATEILNFIAEHHPEDYEAFVLRLVDGCSYEEIAAQRGRGETAEGVRSRIRRIEEAIRNRG